MENTTEQLSSYDQLMETRVTFEFNNNDIEHLRKLLEGCIEKPDDEKQFRNLLEILKGKTAVFESELVGILDMTLKDTSDAEKDKIITEVIQVTGLIAAVLKKYLDLIQKLLGDLHQYINKPELIKEIEVVFRNFNRAKSNLYFLEKHLRYDYLSLFDEDVYIIFEGQIVKYTDHSANHKMGEEGISNVELVRKEDENKEIDTSVLAGAPRFRILNEEFIEESKYKLRIDEKEVTDISYSLRGLIEKCKEDLLANPVNSEALEILQVTISRIFTHAFSVVSPIHDILANSEYMSMIIENARNGDVLDKQLEELRIPLEVIGKPLTYTDEVLDEIMGKEKINKEVIKSYQDKTKEFLSLYSDLTVKLAYYQAISLGKNFGIKEKSVDEEAMLERPKLKIYKISTLVSVLSSVILALVLTGRECSHESEKDKKDKDLKLLQLKNVKINQKLTNEKNSGQQCEDDNYNVKRKVREINKEISKIRAEIRVISAKSKRNSETLEEKILELYGRWVAMYYRAQAFETDPSNTTYNTIYFSLSRELLKCIDEEKRSKGKNCCEVENRNAFSSNKVRIKKRPCNSKKPKDMTCYRFSYGSPIKTKCFPKSGKRK